MVDYDAEGRVITQTLGSGASARTIRYGYFEGTGSPLREGQLATVELSELDLTYELVPDVWGRILSTTRPDGEDLLLSYEPGGNLASVQPPDRTAHTMTYTALGDFDLYTAPPATPTEAAAVLDHRLLLRS